MNAPPVTVPENRRSDVIAPPAGRPAGKSALRKNSDMTPGEAALRNAPAASTPVRAAFRLSMSASGAAGSPTAIGPVQAGVLRRDRPGSLNTRFARFGN